MKPIAKAGLMAGAALSLASAELPAVGPFQAEASQGHTIELSESRSPLMGAEDSFHTVTSADFRNVLPELERILGDGTQVRIKDIVRVSDESHRDLNFDPYQSGAGFLIVTEPSIPGVVQKIAGVSDSSVASVAGAVEKIREQHPDAAIDDIRQIGYGFDRPENDLTYYDAVGYGVLYSVPTGTE